jgi:hypothetical protein
VSAEPVRKRERVKRDGDGVSVTILGIIRVVNCPYSPISFPRVLRVIPLSFNSFSGNIQPSPFIEYPLTIEGRHDSSMGQQQAVSLGAFPSRFLRAYSADCLGRKDGLEEERLIPTVK